MLADKELEKKWLTALRSGDYRQTDGLLHRHAKHPGNEGDKIKVDKFCCLGVLCKLAGIEPELYAEYMDDEGDTLLPLYYEYADSSEYAPEHLLDIDTQRLLARLNDDGWTFLQIADYIEGKVKVDADGNPVDATGSSGSADDGAA